MQNNFSPLSCFIEMSRDKWNTRNNRIIKLSTHSSTHPIIFIHHATVIHFISFPLVIWYKKRLNILISYIHRFYTFGFIKRPHLPPSFHLNTFIPLKAEHFSIAFLYCVRITLHLIICIYFIICYFPLRYFKHFSNFFFLLPKESLYKSWQTFENSDEFHSKHMRCLVKDAHFMNACLFVRLFLYG